MRVIKVKIFEKVPQNHTGIVEHFNGTKEWYLNGLLHREDGPAWEASDGSKEWYLNDEYHREDGPAVEYADGTKFWYLKGKCHREDGPAVEWPNGTKEWWINGRYIISLPSESQPFIFLEEFLNEEGKHQIKVLTKQEIEIWPNLPGLKECADNWEKE